jgi:hypothetical protein
MSATSSLLRVVAGFGLAGLLLVLTECVERKLML